MFDDSGEEVCEGWTGSLGSKSGPGLAPIHPPSIRNRPISKVLDRYCTQRQRDRNVQLQIREEDI